MLPIVSTLLGNGLSLLANAAVVNGKDYVKDQTGVDLDKPILSQQDLVALKRYEAEHEEELLKLKLEDNQLGIDELKAYVGEKSDARKRESTLRAREGAAPEQDRGADDRFRHHPAHVLDLLLRHGEGAAGGRRPQGRGGLHPRGAVGHFEPDLQLLLRQLAGERGQVARHQQRAGGRR
jgi:hypothetical protein